MNHGLDWNRELKEQTEEDWVFGGTRKHCVARISINEREKYLPKGEIQYGIEDTMDCATRAPINALESKFNYLLRNGKLSEDNRQWLHDNGYVTGDSVTFSDAFIAILSGTTESGNSLKAPLHAIHKYGLIPKSILPLDKSMSFNDYHNPHRVTDDMIELGKEFLRRFCVNYQRVDVKDFQNVLHDSMIVTGGYAWPRPDTNGVYPSVDMPFNHAFLLWGLPKYQAFDNYYDSYDGDFIKNLAPDYRFVPYGYRIFLSYRDAEPENEMQDLFSRGVDKLLQLWRIVVR